MDSSEVDLRPDLILFNETPATFLVEVASPQVAKKLFGKVSYYILGQTTKYPTISVTRGNKKISAVRVDQLKLAWQKPMRKIFH